MQPLVAIILINYNGFDDTIECVKSLDKISYDNYRIVVWDNGSTISPTSEQLYFLKERTDYVEGEQNLGFAGGNNAAIRYAQNLHPAYWLLLNNDTIVTADFLSVLVEKAEQRINAGIICGKIYWFDSGKKIWFAGGTYNPYTCSIRHSKLDEDDQDETDYVASIEFATGCMWLIRNLVWEEIGEMEESLFLYAEDTDYCRRVRAAGYQIYFCNKAVIYHKVSRSTGATSKNTQYYLVRNELYIIGWHSKCKLLAYLVKLARFFMDIVKGRKNVDPVVQGIHDYVLGVKGKRKE